ncbi:MAG: serine hydrolase [bacterium]|nr:serine hydrolase [bacterium]
MPRSLMVPSIVTACLVSLAVGPLFAEPVGSVESLKQEISALQAQWQIPGMAVGIISDGKVIFAEGFGYRSLEGKEPVNTATLFRIGSCSKALTALSYGVAMQKEHVSPAATIKDIITGFELEDDWATEAATIGDLLTHQSGLGRYSLLSHGSNFSRAELCERVRYLPLAAGFRERFVYSNLNYALAAHALEVATGSVWEDYVGREVFDPLGMNSTCFSLQDMKASGNHAQPCQVPLRDLSAEPYLLDVEKWDTFNPAGGVISSVDDLLKWLELCLNDGRPLLDKPIWEAIITPYIGRGYSSTANFRTSAYSLGWNVYNYRGHHLVSHSGIVSGYCANMSFMPFEGLGIVVLTNLKHHSLHDALPRIIYDRLLGLEEYDHNGEYLQVWQNMAEGIAERDAGLLATRIPGTRPTLELEKYAGRYVNQAYGVLEVTPGKDNQLVGDFNGLVTWPMEHFHHDVWILQNKIKFEFDMLGLQFRLGPNGEVEELVVREEMVGDGFVFIRQVD